VVDAVESGDSRIADWDITFGDTAAYFTGLGTVTVHIGQE